MQLAEVIVEALREALGTAPATLHEPWFCGNEWKYVKDCIQ